MELIFERLKNVTAKRALRVVINLIGCAMFAIIAFYGWKQVMKLHMFGTLTSALKIPKYITYIPIPFFSAIMAVRFLGHSIGNFSDIIHRKPVKTVEAAS
jgi:TRAP-type C4-dicarboxylate transport system permease small subunit